MADDQAIRTVINQQFGAEVAYKEAELQRIDDRIQLARMMLHRLRLGILAQQYGLSGFYLTEDYSKENVGAQVSWNNFESDFLDSRQQEQEEVVQKREVGAGGGGREVGGIDSSAVSGLKREESTPEFYEGATTSAESSVQSSRVPSEAGDDDIGTTADSRLPPEIAGSSSRKVSSLLNDLRRISPTADSSVASSSTSARAAGGVVSEVADLTWGGQCEEDPTGPSSSCLPANLSRFATKKRMIVGNTSQFLDHSARSTIDGSTHKWMVYVRGPREEPDITSFVRAVRFFLHPSYHPNDIVRVSKSPFHLTRYGWGEFPVRVQLEFTDKCNKHVDIIHNLVLDRTHTGHQTLGSETVVDLDLVTSESAAPVKTGVESSGITSRNNSIHPFSASLSNLKTNETTNTERDLGTTAEGECSRHIHHVFLPATATADQVLLDHCYAHIVVVSRRPRPLQTTSAEETMDLEGRNDQSNLEDEESILNDYLHSVVKTVPLCGPESNGFHLVAPSLDHFRSWNMGRRRASEWMRALAMKRLLQSMEPPVAASLTTKQLVEWCRRNGYTPLDPAPASGRGFCKYCGCRLPSGWEETDRSESNSHPRCLDMMEVQQEGGRRAGSERAGSSDSENEAVEEGEGEGEQAGTSNTIRHQFSTLSDPFQLFESVAENANRLRVAQEEQGRDHIVDVFTLPSSRHQVVPESVPRFRVPQTPELKWVQRTAAAIGIRIYPAVIDHMYAHVVEHMIYMACTKFARIIMDRAVTESAQQLEGVSNEERCIVPLHLYRAVENLECCDFLTNAHMGVPLPESAATAPATDRDRTLREE